MVASVIRRNGEILLCRRPAHKRHGGLWEFPGGKIEEAEDYFGAAKRELAEELGVTVVSVKASLFSRQDPGSHFVIDFHPVEIIGEPVCHEHSEMAWVREEDLHTYDLAPSDKEFVCHLTKRKIRK